MFNCPASTHWLIDCAVAQCLHFMFPIYIASKASLIEKAAKKKEGS